MFGSDKSTVIAAFAAGACIGMAFSNLTSAKASAPATASAPAPRDPLVLKPVAPLTVKAVEGRPLAGKVAIVTGSSSGVGEAVVLMLADQGCDVVVNYASSSAAAEDVAKRCRDKGVRVLVQQADVGSDAGCETLVAATVKELGRIDYLVNNAGTTKFIPLPAMDRLTTEDFMRTYSVNAVGPFTMIKLCAPHMKAAGGGRVVNVSSIAGAYQTVGSCLPYIMSKSAVNGLTSALGKALGPDITMNAVCPGFIAGKWLQKGLDKEYGPGAYDYVKGNQESKNPQRTVSTPEDVASTIMWLLNGATTITGQHIVCDAGYGLHRGPV